MDKEAVSQDLAQDELILETREGIAYATINRPDARNAVSTPLINRLLAFLETIKADSNVHVLLLQAKGKSFIAGGDLKLFAAGLAMTDEERGEDMKQRAARAGRLCTALATLPQPVIVATRGPTVGVGVSIVCAADLAIASDTAQFRLSHVNLGLSPDGAATYFLPRQIGLKRTNEIAMLGGMISATEAHAMGLINQVVPDAELESRAEALARQLATGPAAALAEIKILVRASSGRDLPGQVAAETESLQKCALTPDYAEGLRAMLERRPAYFGTGYLSMEPTSDG